MHWHLARSETLHSCSSFPWMGPSSVGTHSTAILQRSGSVWAQHEALLCRPAWGSLPGGRHAQPLHVHPIYVHQSPKATPSLLCSTQGPDEDDEEGSLETRMGSPWWQRTRLITTVLINLGNIMERADEQILPAGEVRLSELLQQPAALLPRGTAGRLTRGLGPPVCNSQAAGTGAAGQTTAKPQPATWPCGLCILAA